MLTECNATLFDFAPVEGRQVVAAFDGGTITSDAGALLLGETDRAIRLTDRFASCFIDTRMAELVEHEVATMVLQRVVGIALGYEDLNGLAAKRVDLHRWLASWAPPGTVDTSDKLLRERGDQWRRRSGDHLRTSSNGRRCHC